MGGESPVNGAFFTEPEGPPQLLDTGQKEAIEAQTEVLKRIATALERVADLMKDDADKRSFDGHRP
jgi:hypothetical protein